MGLLMGLWVSLLVKSLDERSVYRLAEAWAPTFFHSVSLEYSRAETGFNPVDDILSLNFDGNQNFSDNGDAVFALSPEQEVEASQNPVIYFSVIESETHYYLNYFVYHAVDYGAMKHGHDTENVWIILKKNNTPLGSFVALVSNAHGLAMIYSVDFNREERWRSKLPKDFRRKFLAYLDLSSRDHHTKGRLELIERHAGGSSPALFIATRTHAIYKWNQEVWGSKRRDQVYIPYSCQECLERVNTLASVKQYRLIHWDRWFDDTLKEFESGKRPIDEWKKMFSPLEKGVSLSGGRYQERTLPRYLANSWRNEKFSGSLFYRSRMGFSAELIDPALKHSHFERRTEGVSLKYLRNFYVESNQGLSMTRPSLWSRSGVLDILYRLVGMTQDY